MLPVQTKKPGSKQPFGIDFSSWCDRFGDTIATAEWTVPDGLTEHGDEPIGDVAVIVLGGGTHGDPLYEVRCHVTFTTTQYEAEDTLPIKVEH